MKTLTALLAGVACLLAACDDKPKPGGPVPKAELVVPSTGA
ncbi:hypothetical protein ACFPPF_01165 [Xenophilus aerolatus]|nr:hypothetical protein [Xenophilus aerolatus]